MTYLLEDAIGRRLEALAREKGKTMQEVLRDALALEKWLTEERNPRGLNDPHDAR